MTVPYMRDIINEYVQILNEEAKKAAKDDTIDYYDSKKQMSDKERISRMVPTELDGKATNPNDSSSLGKDGENKATDNFSGGKKLDRIDQLKKSVEVLQRISHASEKESDSKAIDKIIDDMNDEIDSLSDELVDNH